MKSSVPAWGKCLNFLGYRCHPGPFRGHHQPPPLSEPSELSLATAAALNQIKQIFSKNKLVSFIKGPLRAGHPGRGTVYKVGDYPHGQLVFSWDICIELIEFRTEWLYDLSQGRLLPVMKQSCRKIWVFKLLFKKLNSSYFVCTGNNSLSCWWDSNGWLQSRCWWANTMTTSQTLALLRKKKEKYLYIFLE